MDLETLKARYYILYGQAQEAKNVYERAEKEVNDQAQKKQEEEAKKNVNPEKQPEPATTTEPQAPRQ